MRAAKRRWRWRRNPLRRRIDVLDAWLALAATVLLVVGAPAAGVSVGSWSYGEQSRSMREQQRARHPVTAELTQDVPMPKSQRDGTMNSAYPTKVRWRAPDGAVRSGETEVATGRRKGAHVTVWILNDGRLTAKPLDHVGVLSAATATGMWAAAGAGTVVLSSAWWARRALDRRRLRTWAEEWAEVGPLWRGRTG